MLVLAQLTIWIALTIIRGFKAADGFALTRMPALSSGNSSHGYNNILQTFTNAFNDLSVVLNAHTTPVHIINIHQSNTLFNVSVSNTSTISSPSVSLVELVSTGAQWVTHASTTTVAATGSVTVSQSAEASSVLVYYPRSMIYGLPRRISTAFVKSRLRVIEAAKGIATVKKWASRIRHTIKRAGADFESTLRSQLYVFANVFPASTRSLSYAELRTVGGGPLAATTVLSDQVWKFKRLSSLYRTGDALLATLPTDRVVFDPATQSVNVISIYFVFHCAAENLAAVETSHTSERVPTEGEERLELLANTLEHPARIDQTDILSKCTLAMRSLQASWANDDVPELGVCMLFESMQIGNSTFAVMPRERVKLGRRMRWTSGKARSEETESFTRGYWAYAVMVDKQASLKLTRGLKRKMWLGMLYLHRLTMQVLAEVDSRINPDVLKFAAPCHDVEGVRVMLVILSISVFPVAASVVARVRSGLWMPHGSIQTEVECARDSVRFDCGRTELIEDIQVALPLAGLISASTGKPTPVEATIICTTGMPDVIDDTPTNDNNITYAPAVKSKAAKKRSAAAARKKLNKKLRHEAEAVNDALPFGPDSDPSPEPVLAEDSDAESTGSVAVKATTLLAIPSFSAGVSGSIDQSSLDYDLPGFTEVSRCRGRPKARRRTDDVQSRTQAVLLLQRQVQVVVPFAILSRLLVQARVCLRLGFFFLDDHSGSR